MAPCTQLLDGCKGRVLLIKLAITDDIALCSSMLLYAIVMLLDSSRQYLQPSDIMTVETHPPASSSP